MNIKCLNYLLFGATQTDRGKKQIRTNLVDYECAMAEVKMMLKVDHPNIVKFEDSFFSEKNNELVIIIEYCPCKFISIFPLMRFYRRRPARLNWFL